MIIPNNTCHLSTEAEASSDSSATTSQDVFCSSESETYREQFTFEDSMLEHTVRIPWSITLLADLKVHPELRKECCGLRESSNRPCAASAQ